MRWPTFNKTTPRGPSLSRKTEINHFGCGFAVYTTIVPFIIGEGVWGKTFNNIDFVTKSRQLTLGREGVKFLNILTFYCKSKISLIATKLKIDSLYCARVSGTTNKKHRGKIFFVITTSTSEID